MKRIVESELMKKEEDKDYSGLVKNNSRAQTVMYRDIVRFLTNEKEPKNVLDIGCGEGTLLKKISKIFPKATLIGIDESREMVKKAKEEGVAKILNSSLEEYPLENKFEMILCNLVLHHQENPEKFITDATNHLTKEGILIINDLVRPKSREALEMRLKERRKNLGHYGKITEEIARKSCQSALAKEELQRLISKIKNSRINFYDEDWFERTLIVIKS